VIDIIDNSEVTVSSTSAAGVREQKLSANQQTEPSSDYIRTEFPTFFAENVTHTLTEFFVALLPADPRIEHIYWDWDESNVLRVWIVIPEPDFSLESPIYDAQMKFMESFPKYDCDFYVIYRFGKSDDSIRPQNAKLVK